MAFNLMPGPLLMAASAAILGLLLACLALAWRHFFRVPLRGVALACVLYAAGWVLQ